MAKNPKFNPHPLAPTIAAETTVPIPRPAAPGPLKGILRPRGSAKGGGEPATAMHPRNIQERMGSRLRINVKMPGPQLPEAQATQANGRLMSPVMGQSRNFWVGQATHQ